MWAILVLVSLICPISNSYIVNYDTSENWWTHSVIYQIYPRSFKDSNGDGLGDIPGITSKLEHVKDTGADALYLSPIFTSPQKDFGYDITNYTDIYEDFGTLEDFDEMVSKAHDLGLKVILDYVPNHSSDEHVWFQNSVDKIPPYDDYYVWKDPREGPNGERLPPNDWLSAFGGSAWEWNDKRQQYYYHVYLAGQPDFNYRNPALRKEMEDVLSFWLARGVDGFRVDSANLLFEDAQLRNEPLMDPSLTPDNYEHIFHKYTRILDDNYEVVASWRNLMDRFSLETKTDRKFLILEVHAPIPHKMGYYDVGADPFNFMFLFNLTGKSTASDFNRLINEWLDVIPEGRKTNWIVGNHDNHRVATRFGKNGSRADQMTMLAIMLPGMVMVYNGDEIGMVDKFFTWEETMDPFGCQTGPDGYQLNSRDPERTPFQWDASVSAGFSENPKTWLPVHDNYKKLNLANQKKAKFSHYKVFQAMTRLKKSQILRRGSTEVKLASKDVLAVVRRLKGQKPIALLINFSDFPVEFDAKLKLNLPEEMDVYIASVRSGLKTGQKFNTSQARLRGSATVVLI
ncbi:hypothetical protein QAD02_009862 [Eretmocerus hayati]|uniref:Uncharacterized protein n=1 Tax=Eretmocerus hayati TaxID=131215 RepID=A0ACC2NAH1_9HYME|nr:hypothetical protein QAD02_009862 [Eretmocerus hayati]